MEGIDLNLVLREMLHATPIWSVLFLTAHSFMKKHQRLSEKMEESVRSIQLSLASANLPKIQSDLENLKEISLRHEQMLKLRQAKFNGGLD